MAKTSTIKIAVDEIVDTVENEKNEEAKKITKRSVNVESLNGSDEIEVESLVHNVSYKDSKTLDMYEWEEAGHIEYVPFEVLQNMWRINKGYFKNLWLKPCDDRVITKFGLAKTYEKFEFLMDENNYTKKNIESILDTISKTTPDLKFTIYNKIKSMVVDGKITDVSVIRTLEKRLNIELIDFL